eukprot:UN27845
MIIEFTNTPEAKCYNFNSQDDVNEQLGELFKKMEAHRENWVSDGNAEWLQSLIKDFTPEQLEQLALDIEIMNKKNPKAQDAWELRSKLSQNNILFRWFSNRTLDEVIKKCKECNHFDYPAGFRLRGKALDKLRWTKDLKHKEFKEHCAPFGGSVHTYTISKHNIFDIEFTAHRNVEDVIYETRTGSLNTTMNMDKNNKDPLVTFTGKVSHSRKNSVLNALYSNNMNKNRNDESEILDNINFADIISDQKGSYYYRNKH